MVDRRPRTAKTQDELLQMLPGWKPPVAKGAEGGDPPAVVAAGPAPLIPDFKLPFKMISKDELDFYQQEQMEEVNAITPYQVTILPQKRSRKVESFIMGWSVKDTDGMQRAYKELQQPSVGRKARVDGATDDVIVHSEADLE